MNPLYLIDFYKVGHVKQYPQDTEQVWSNWTARSTRVEGETHAVFFGLQYFVKETLIDKWNAEFFGVHKQVILKQYRELIAATLGDTNPKTDHIEKLHDLGYLPIDIYALPEGSLVPLGVPMLVITNTHPDFFWLPNYFETILSAKLWKPCTSASTARRYRKLFLEYARKANESDLSFVDWMGHDFSFRGMSGEEDAILSGMGHLLSFSGTDTVPAILAARKYYNAALSCGGSVNATEHSVMCAGEESGEFETFRHLIEDVYPTGIVSIVSDTWDLWRVLTDYIPRLKDKILARDGKIVIRPDSGDPVRIIIGEDDNVGDAQGCGVATLLENALGSTISSGGFVTINKAGMIYGDSITVDRARAILSGLIQKGFSPYNMVFGIGSYTYEYVTRDTYNFAMKATAVKRHGEVIDIFKKPITDNSHKASHKGIPTVYWSAPGNDYVVSQGSKPGQLDACAFSKVFSNGELRIEQTFDEIRQRVRSGL